MLLTFGEFIDHALRTALALEVETGKAQGATDGCQAAVADFLRTVALLQALADLADSPPAASIVAGGLREGLGNHLLQSVDALETLVVFDEAACLFVVQPVALTVQNLLAQLGIKRVSLKSMSPVTSTQRKRRLPVGSLSGLGSLVVPMNDA